MRVGPMPIVAADRLMRILQKNGHEAELLMNGDLPASESQPSPEEPAHSRTENPANLCYVEFDESYLEFVREDLVRLGLIYDDDHVSTGDELDGTDWICPKCGKEFGQPGRCPVHATELVSFEDFAAGKRNQTNPLNPVVMILIVAAVLGAIYMISRP